MTTSPSPIMMPTVHLNGTSIRELIAGWNALSAALAEAERAANKVEFNARDYYPQGPDAFGLARRAMDDHVSALRRFREEADEIAVRLSEIEEERRTR